MKTKIKKFTFLSLCMFLISSCATSYKIGEKFEIELEQDGVGGYTWEYVKIPEVEVIDSMKTKIKKENQFTEYLKTYVLKGKEKGTYKLNFRKKRSFEPDSLIPKDNYRTLKIRITK